MSIAPVDRSLSEPFEDTVHAHRFHPMIWTRARLRESQQKHARAKGFPVSKRGKELGFMPITERYFRSGCCDGNLGVVLGNLWNTLRDGWDIDDLIQGETGLHLAIRHQNQNVALFLLEMGANWKTQTANGMDCHDLALACELYPVCLRIQEMYPVLFVST